jgi:hypothetical protein
LEITEMKGWKARGVSALKARVGFAVICALFLGAADPACAQTKLRGKRDISGPWMNFPFIINFDPAVRPGEPQRVSLTPEYEARYKASEAAIAKGEAEGKPVVDLVTKCLPIGMPGSNMAFFPMEIVPTAKVIYVLLEGVDPPRRIFIDGRPMPPLEDLDPTFEGYSVGHWEGNTLIVETAGIKTSTQIAGVPHSNALRVHERIRLLDDHTLEDQMTITDPKAFKTPWVITKQYKDYDTMPVADQSPGPHPEHRPLVADEFVCNENNRNLPDANGVVGATMGSAQP